MSDGRGDDRDAAIEALAETGVDPDYLEKQRVANDVRAKLFGAKAPTITIGRFQVVDKIGAGAMGVVYAALDPDLNRKVAIKLVQHGRGNSERQRLRMLREAQALARLSHPNVVTIYEVGTYDGQVFIAMEFVEGENITEWLRRTQPDWQQIIEVMLGAGRGLQAAHAMELVHRDVKPDNIAVDAAGRARVLDFGLVAADGEASESGESPRPSQHHRQPFAVSLTQTGGLVGTPNYMAPEQLTGQAVDARSDQYSFCVSVYHALYGQLPFHAASFEQLVDDVMNGVRVPPPADTVVPRAVQDILARGMSLDPGARFDSMGALVSALEACLQPARSPLRWLVPAGIGLAMLASVLVVSLTGGDPEPTRRSEAVVQPTDARALTADVDAARVAAEVDAGAKPSLADIDVTPAPPKDDRAAALRTKLDAARGLIKAGKYDDARRALKVVIAQVEATPSAPLSSRTLAGQALLLLGDVKLQPLLATPKTESFGHAKLTYFAAINIYSDAMTTYGRATSADLGLAQCANVRAAAGAEHLHWLIKNYNDKTALPSDKTRQAWQGIRKMYRFYRDSAERTYRMSLQIAGGGCRRQAEAGVTRMRALAPPGAVQPN